MMFESSLKAGRVGMDDRLFGNAFPIFAEAGICCCWLDGMEEAVLFFTRNDDEYPAGGNDMEYTRYRLHESRTGCYLQHE